MTWSDNLVDYSLNLGAADSLFDTNEQCLYTCVRLNYCEYTLSLSCACTKWYLPRFPS